MHGNLLLSVVARGDFWHYSSYFSRCIFFEVPHSGYPSALLSAQTLASPPARGRGRGMAAVTVLLDKLYRNLHKPQCSRCRGRLEETVFPLVSLWLLWLFIPRTGSWRNLGGRHFFEQSGFLTLLGYKWLGKAWGLPNLLPPGWFLIKKWMGCPPRRSRAGISWLCLSIAAGCTATSQWTSRAGGTNPLVYSTSIYWVPTILGSWGLSTNKTKTSVLMEADRMSNSK